MKTTFKLITAMLCALALTCAYAEDMEHSSDVMVMHHMHVLINHAMEMAAGGSNLIMLGQMGMSKNVDEMTVKHGQMMIEDAKSLINEVMKSKEMVALHKEGFTTEKSAEMAFTHKLANAAKAYIDMISEMPSATTGGEDHMNMKMH